VVIGVEVEVRVVVPAPVFDEAGRIEGAAPDERDVVDDRRLVGARVERELGTKTLSDESSIARLLITRM
jgi:hypothetical protein